MESNLWCTAPAGPDSSTSQESHFMSTGSRESDRGLNHVHGSEQAMLVDVSSKEDGKRVAAAACKFLLGQKAFYLVACDQVAKGDVLYVASTAGIDGAKQTSKLIPLNRNVSATQVRAGLALNVKAFGVEIEEGEAATTYGKTGAEMEAMTAVAVAGPSRYTTCAKLLRRKFLSLKSILKHEMEERAWIRPIFMFLNKRDGSD